MVLDADFAEGVAAIDGVRVLEETFAEEGEEHGGKGRGRSERRPRGCERRGGKGRGRDARRDAKRGERIDDTATKLTTWDIGRAPQTCRGRLVAPPGLGAPGPRVGGGREGQPSALLHCCRQLFSCGLGVVEWS